MDFSNLRKRAQKRSDCCCQWDVTHKLERLFQVERQYCQPGRWTGCPQMCLLGCFWQSFCIWLWSRHKRIDVKFHNQLHFKPYMHILGHDETLSLRGPWYDSCRCGFWCILLAVIFRYLPREIKIRDSLVCLFLNPLPQGIAKPLDVKYYLKKNGMAPSLHLILKCTTTFCPETVSVLRLNERSSLPSSKCITVF